MRRWSRSFAVGWCVIAAACGDGDDDASAAVETPTGLTCGNGTTESAGQCVAESTDTLACGAGTVERDGACVATTDPLSCGEGTTEQGGACVPANPLACGAGTVEDDGACVPESVLACGVDTTEVSGECVSNVVKANGFGSALVPVFGLPSKNNHMHLDEVRFRASDNRLYICSYDFAVMDVANPGNPKYLLEGVKLKWPAGQGNMASYPATGTRTGGCINLAIDGDFVHVTHRGNIDDPSLLSGFQLTPGASPGSLVVTQLPVFAEPGISYEGIDFGDGHLYVGLGVDGFTVIDYDAATSTYTRRGTLGDLNHVLGLRVVGDIVYAADGLGGVITIDVSDPDAPTLISRLVLPGQARDVRVDARVDRTTVYVAAGSAGLVVVDATDPANMKQIGQAATPGSAQRLDYTADRVYLAAWNDARVYDVSDPSQPSILGAARLTRQLSGTTGETSDERPAVTSRVLGIAASSNDPDIVYVGNWHYPNIYRLHADQPSPYVYLPEGANLVDFGVVTAGDTVQGALIVSNHGTAPLSVVNNWTSNSDFAVTPEQLTIAPGASATLSLAYTAATADKAESILNIVSDDPQQPIRKAYLVANLGGLGVGSPLPETVVALTDGGEWSSTAPENAGKVQLLAYFATF